jgi:collagenase-like PrtC family protease
MHKLSVAYNWDSRLLEEVVKNKYPVYDFYASAQHTSIGGGRPSFILPQPTEGMMRDQIKRMHEHGIEFTYVLNAPCMSGQEFVRETHEKMITEFQWIQDVGSDGVVLTIPYLMEIVKAQFPKLKIRVSTIAKVNSVNKARYFEALGASAITPDIMINRNFRVLEKMVKATKCEINLLMTDGCLYECRIDKLANPAEILRCRWVRPEDIPHYEAIGITSFKIGGRRLTTDRILTSIKAYSEKKYAGNLADIIEGFAFIADGITEANPAKDAIKPHVRIDNSKLDGFIDFFKKQDCDANCNDCKYCEQWAKKAVTMNRIGADMQLFSLGSVRKGLASSRFFGLDVETRNKTKKKGFSK